MSTWTPKRRKKQLTMMRKLWRTFLRRLMVHLAAHPTEGLPPRFHVKKPDCPSRKSRDEWPSGLENPVPRVKWAFSLRRSPVRKPSRSIELFTSEGSTYWRAGHRKQYRDPFRLKRLNPPPFQNPRFHPVGQGLPEKGDA